MLLCEVVESLAGGNFSMHRNLSVRKVEHKFYANVGFVVSYSDVIGP